MILLDSSVLIELFRKKDKEQTLFISSLNQILIYVSPL
jgi:predicted nucleic acid-binding protein